MTVVALGLVSALTWGAGDFSGGLLGRRAPVLSVVLVSQLVGTAVALALGVGSGERVPPEPDVAWSIAGGVFGCIGIVGLYRGLAIGRMGVVAPVTGVLAAAIPVAFGIVFEGAPTSITVFGIVLAIVAVVVVSRIDDGRDGPSGLGLALVAGLALGGFSVTISQIGDGHAFIPLTIIRATEALLIGAVLLVGRQPWRAERRLIPAMAGVGVLDMAGNAGFILAVQAGSLAIAAALSSLYPATTVVLAAIVLRERVTRSHVVGLVLAATAIVCIAAGSA
jgi:drug/metabolite transporter (DMT)-like permease